MRKTLVTALFLTSAAGLGRAADVAPFQWQGPLAAGQTLEIRSVNGGIRIEKAAGDLVEVTAVIQGANPDPSTIRVDVVSLANGLMFCAVYPGSESWCDPDGPASVTLVNADATVEFLVRVPAGVRVKSRTVNGTISAQTPDN